MFSKIANMIKQWWRPSEYTVTYCNTFGMCMDYYDKYTYNNLEDAKKRMDYLNSCMAEKLLQEENFQFIPNYIRIQQVISPNPIRRLLNRCGSKRLYKVFGYWI